MDRTLEGEITIKITSTMINNSSHVKHQLFAKLVAMKLAYRLTKFTILKVEKSKTISQRKSGSLDAFNMTLLVEIL